MIESEKFTRRLKASLNFCRASMKSSVGGGWALRRSMSSEMLHIVITIHCTLYARVLYTGCCYTDYICFVIGLFHKLVTKQTTSLLSTFLVETSVLYTLRHYGRPTYRQAMHSVSPLTFYGTRSHRL